MYHRLLNNLTAVWQCLHVVDTSTVSGGCVSYTQHSFLCIWNYWMMNGWICSVGSISEIRFPINVFGVRTTM